MSWSVFWPLYTVYPIATIGFYVNYLVVFPSVAQRVLKTRYERLDKVSKLCFVANLGSIVHSYAVVLLILIAFLMIYKKQLSLNTKIKLHRQVS